MANKKKEVFRPGPMTEGKRNIIQGLHMISYMKQKSFQIMSRLMTLLVLYVTGKTLMLFMCLEDGELHR